jgi:predicted house-cleaning NTP pyrophosphatase (Maf/HAM1 superfamily)
VRYFLPLPLLALFAAFATADEKPTTKAEYDALAKPIREKLQKANADWADAGKRVANAKAVKGAGEYLEDYLLSKDQAESAAKRVADAKAADKTKDIKMWEALLAQTSKDAAGSKRRRMRMPPKPPSTC